MTDKDNVPMAQAASDNASAEAVHTNVAENSGEASLDKGFNKALIAAVIGGIAVVVAVIAAVALIVPMVMTTPYQRAEMAFWRGLMSAMPDVEGGTRIDFTATYVPGRGVRDLFGTNMPDVSAEGFISMLGAQMLMQGTINADGDRVELVYAMDGGQMTLAAPGVTNYFLRFVNDPDSFGTTAELDTRALNRTIRAIVQEYFALADRIADVESGITVRGGDVELTATRHRMSFRQRDLMELALFALREIRDNRNLVNFVDDLMHSEFGHGGDAFIDIIDDLILDVEDFMLDLRGDGDILFRMSVYIHRGQIIQRRLDRFLGGDGVEILHRFLVDGNRAFIESSFGTDYVRLEFSGRFERSGRTWNGHGRFTVTETWYDWRTGRRTTEDVMSISYNIDGFRFNDGQLQGMVRVRHSDGGFGFDVTTNWEANGRRGQRVSANIRITDGGRTYDVGEFTLTVSESSIRRLNMPSWNDQDAVIVDGSGFENTRGANPRHLYEDLGIAARDFRGNALLEGMFDELQWMVRDLFWRERF